MYVVDDIVASKNWYGIQNTIVQGFQIHHVSFHQTAVPIAYPFAVLQ
jgi:hypothetical protein